MTAGLSKAFTAKSTAEDWNVRGEEMFRRNLFEQAVMCYMKSGNKLKQHESRANQMVVEARKPSTNPTK